MSQNYNLVTILGATASGKTAVAAHLAHKLGSAVISADSRQVYRGMDIGTGKDIEEYMIDGVRVPYYLIDIVNAGEKYNLFEYQHDFIDVYSELSQHALLPVLCGGSGLYIESVLKAYKLIAVPINTELRLQLEQLTMDELADILRQYRPLHNTSDIDNKKRAIRAIEIEKYKVVNNPSEYSYPTINSLIIGIHFDRAVQKQRITERLHARIQNGMIEEVKTLLDKGIKAEELIYYGLEYKFITLYLTGALKYDEMLGKLNIAIHQFAKRQMTWFRKMERDGFVINWIDGNLPLLEMINIIENLIYKR